MASGYALGSTLRFGDEKPPIFTQIVAASGVARYLTNAWVAGSSLNATIVSPPPTTLAGEPLTDGKANWLKPVSGFAFVESRMTPCTKSPSKTIAPFGGVV